MRNKENKPHTHGIFRIRDFGGAPVHWKWTFVSCDGFFSVEKTSLSPQVVVIAYEYDETKTEGHARSKSAFLGALLYPGKSFVSCYGFFQSKRHHYHLKSSSLHMNTTKQRPKGTRARNPRFGGRSCILEMEFCKLLRVFSVEKTSLLPQVVVIAYEYDKTKSVGHAGSKSGIWGPLLYPGNGVL